MILVKSCTKPADGTQCSSCIDSSQCNEGLSCYKMSYGGSINSGDRRCMAKAGDYCPGY